MVKKVSFPLLVSRGKQSEKQSKARSA